MLLHMVPMAVIGVRNDLGKPTTTALKNKRSFMEYLEKGRNMMKEYGFTYSFGKMYENLEKLINSGALENKKVILFGLGLPSIAMKRFLEERRYKVYAIIDKNEKYTGSVFENCMICLPENLLKKFDDNIVVLIASSHYSEMSLQLQNMSYLEQKHFFDVINYESIAENLKKKISQYHILTLKEIQQEEFKMLQYIKKVCAENSLTYFLCAGTLLGAVRHKGFIPWDDDLDISLPYPDYKKLVEAIENDGKYTIINNVTCKSFKWGYSKMMSQEVLGQQVGFPIASETGLFVDIFPIYSLPDDEVSLESVLKENKELKYLLKNKYSYELDGEEFIRLRDQLVDLWEGIGYKKSKRVMRTCVGAAGYFDEEFVSYEAYAKSVGIEFCGEIYPVPIGYDEVLRTLYGDYMKLPPENKRKGHHAYIFYRKGN